MDIKKYVRKNKIDLSGKTVVLTGATGGLGRCILKALILSGAKTVAAVRNTDKAKELLNKLTTEGYDVSNVDVVKLDLSSKAGVDLFLEQFSARYFAADILINNAGMYNLPVQNTDEGIELHMAVNFINPLYLTESMLPYLNGGKIINMSSISAGFYKLTEDCLHLKSKMKAYGYSKMLFLMALLRLKSQKEDFNVKINTVHPGVTGTEIISRANGGGVIFSKVGAAFMRVFFQSAAKSSLAAIDAFSSDIGDNNMSGPWLFDIWGKPKISRLKKQILDEDNQNFALNYYTDLLNKSCSAD